MLGIASHDDEVFLPNRARDQLTALAVADRRAAVLHQSPLTQGTSV